ncbi:MAG: hypothetical protein KME47_06195 [Nodosilinea sp. WJT8-NPBG4]|jgi:hypothetical protein|nr:hypothetical protein [Nodosilinea sp. WJT8-NPBG4]
MGKITQPNSSKLIIQECYDLSQGCIAPIRYDVVINHLKIKYGMPEKEVMDSLDLLKAQGKLKSDTFLDFKLTQFGINTVKRTRGI